MKVIEQNIRYGIDDAKGFGARFMWIMSGSFCNTCNRSYWSKDMSPEKNLCCKCDYKKLLQKCRKDHQTLIHRTTAKCKHCDWEYMRNYSEHKLYMTHRAADKHRTKTFHKIEIITEITLEPH